MKEVPESPTKKNHQGSWLLKNIGVVLTPISLFSSSLIRD